ncbi:Protein of unknown function DUF3651 [Macleaya cordata]|uniref:Uncharacterized protein n=1 Tax=Macleaya cordata TaxID=56857 RepID=A0A200PNM8_MACCD|nr:Protein of unknown function DUF3651 [Macleaya cordata]
METEKTLTKGAEEHLAMFHLKFHQPSKGLHFIFVLSCILFFLATCGPCATRNHLVSEMDGMLGPLEYDACGSYEDNLDTGVQDLLGADISAKYVGENSGTCSGLKAVCANSELFCFPSTLPGFLAEVDDCKAAFVEVLGNHDDATLPEASISNSLWQSNSSWSSDHGAFMLVKGGVVSCSLSSGMELHDVSSTQSINADRDDCASCGGPSLKCNIPYAISDKKSKVIKSDLLDGSSSPHVKISPPSLDWGQNYLYFPSIAFLTVANTCNDSVLHIYEPFSSDTQFYPCDFDEVVLGPGEVASICFIFLPQRLGFLSAHLVLQTSSGGFLIHAKGLAVESLYEIEPLTGMDAYSDGGWSKNLSLHNPFDDTLHVKGVVAWISVFSGNASQTAEAVCKLDTFQGSDQFRSFLNVNQWLDIESGQDGLPLMGIRPRSSWAINPHSTENFMEIDFLSGAQGRVFGAFCVQLESSSHDRTDTVIIPFDAQVHGNAAYSGLRGPVSVSLESLVPCDGSETIAVVLSLRNRVAYLLTVVKISEVTDGKELFHIKYIDGLLLFPGTVTPAAVVTYTSTPGYSQEHPHDIPDLSLDCRLLISTNDSGSPLVEIPCQDIVSTCSRHQVASYIDDKPQDEKSKSGNIMRGSLGSVIQSPSQIKLKALEIAEADELVLRNWKSQGTTSGLSILDDEEVLFPVVQVGSHCSKWITVKNPSAEPVIMQLIMNSGAIIDQCRAADKLTLSSSLVQNDSTRPTRYGFSISATAITEAYVHPYGRAFLGPIVFHPSKRCGWRGSAVIRNNLSGVEWLPLRGFGGSLSLVLLEGFEPIQSLEFNLSMPNPLNVSSPEMLHQIKVKSSICSQPLSKELFAKNTGDLPLEVRRIEVSGADCGLDGFTVNTCKAFSLQPGESKKLLISYRPDFSAAVVHRDLELALATGILVIPMKASIPVYMRNLCRNSIFWILLKKLSLVVFIAAALFCLLFFFVLPQVMADTQDCLFKTESGTISRAREPYCMHPNQGNSRFSMCNYVDNMLKSVREDETSKLGFVGRFSDCSNGVQEQRITAQLTKNVHDFQEQVIGISGLQNETTSVMYSSEAKSVALNETSGLLEAQQTGNLTVRTGKERGRRRRKRRAAGAGLTGLLEVSSSQSGNSTPSSPLSPVSSLTPKRTASPSPEVGNAIEAMNLFADVADKNSKKKQLFGAGSGPTALEPKVSVKYNRGSCSTYTQQESLVPRKTSSKPVLLSSATFPARGHRVPGVVIASPHMTPHARAPGSNLCKETSIKMEEKANHRDEFTYDIWGNHFSGFHLVDKDNGVSSIISNASSGDSQSFFARGPQVLVQKSQARSVSPAHKLPHCSVTCLLQKG